MKRPKFKLKTQKTGKDPISLFCVLSMLGTLCETLFHYLKIPSLSSSHITVTLLGGKGHLKNRVKVQLHFKGTHK